VVVKWSTDEKSSSFVRYGLTEELGSITGDDLINLDSAKFVTEHQVTIKNLPSATKYSYAVVSADEDGNVAKSSIGTFTTSSQSSLSGIKIAATSLQEATVTWTTSNPTSSIVEFGTALEYGQVRKDGALLKEHSIVVSGLQAGVTYHMRVKGEDADGSMYVSSDYTFIPQSPPAISNFQVIDISEKNATVKFTTTIPTDSIIEYIDVKDPKNNGSQGSPEFINEHQIILNDLTPGTTYTAKIKVSDSTGNEAEQVIGDFSTKKDENPPRIEQVKTDNALTQNEKVQTIINWSTDEEATTKIVYKEGGSGQESDVPISDDFTRKHTAIITMFKPGMVYHFNVKSTDKYGNESVSDTFATLTPRKKENIIQIIINNFQEIFKWTQR